MPHYLNTLPLKSLLKQLSKDLRPQQKGIGRVSSLSSILRQLFKSLDDGYHPLMPRYLAIALERYISSAPKYERKTSEFVGEIRRKLLCLHEYNMKIAKMKFKYPRSEQLNAVLVRYVELECGLLYGTYQKVDEEHENKVQQRVLRLLTIIQHDAFHNNEVPQKTTIRARDKALLQLFATVRADCISENRLVANIITKLLEKLDLLEEINKLKGKNIPFYQDTILKDPLVDKIREKFATCDSKSEIDSDEERDISVVSDDIFSNNSSNHKYFRPRSVFSDEMYKPDSDLIKFSQRLKNYEPTQIFGEKENAFPDWSSANNEQMISHNFSQQFNSFNSTNSKNLTRESSPNDVDLTLQHKLTKTTFEEKAVKSLSLPNQAQNSDALFLGQDLSTEIQSKSVRETERTSEQISDFCQKISDSETESISGAVEVNAHSELTNNERDKINLDIPESRITSDNDNSDQLAVPAAEDTDNQTAQETPNDAVVSNFEETPSIVDNSPSDTAPDNHNQASSIEEVAPVEAPQTVQLLEPTKTPPQEDPIDLDALPDTNGFGNNKTSVSESIFNGVVTIEILSDEDDEEADYTFISPKKSGQSQQMYSTPTNLLQVKDIKLEENEENRSPSFSIPTSESDSQNFGDTNNSGLGSSGSSGLNGLKSCNNGGHKETEAAEIVISDSEDDVVDVSEDEDVLVPDTVHVSTVDLDVVIESEKPGDYEEKSNYASDHEEHDLVVVGAGTQVDDEKEDTDNVVATTFNTIEDSTDPDPEVKSTDMPCVEEIVPENVTTVEDHEEEENNDIQKEITDGTNNVAESSIISEIIVNEFKNPEELLPDEEASDIHDDITVHQDHSNNVTDENENQNEDNTSVKESEASELTLIASQESTTLPYNYNDAEPVMAVDNEPEKSEHEHIEIEATDTSFDSGVSKDAEPLKECHEPEELEKPVQESQPDFEPLINQASETEPVAELPVIPSAEFMNEKRVSELLEESAEPENEQQNDAEGEVVEASEETHEEVEATEIAEVAPDPVCDLNVSTENQVQVDETVLDQEDKIPETAPIASNEESSISNADLIDTVESTIEQVNPAPCEGVGEENVIAKEAEESRLEVIDYSITTQYEQPASSDQASQIYDSSVNLSTYNQPLLVETTTEIIKNVSAEILPPEHVSQDVDAENPTINESFIYKSSLISTLNEVEYVEYPTEKKESGDLELLANIAADQETLAVKTDSEKEVLDAASDIEIASKIATTPRRRKSKVRLDNKKKVFARETLPRAVKHPVKHKPSDEDAEPKRITRNRANKAKLVIDIVSQPKSSRNIDSKCKPHDFIAVENRTVPPPTNNVFAQKRFMDATTSEDSNDSCESMLFIDLGEAGKPVEKTVKSVYEEETIDEILEFVTTEQAVCISIPENEENSNSLQILKQMEDFIGNTVSQQLTEKTELPIVSEENEVVATETEDSQHSDTVYGPENLTVRGRMRSRSNEERTLVKPTDHSIENILNITPPNGELKPTPLSTDHFESKVVVPSVNEIVEREVAVTDQEPLLPPNEEPQQNEDISENTDTNKNLDESASKVVDFEKAEMALHESEISKDVLVADQAEETVQIEPENLTVNKSSVGQNEENYCEKTFKTKAAMKAYEDKLQPNPLVLKPKSEFRMRTRSRSKSFEEARREDIFNRSTDLDSVPPISSDSQVDDSMELDKSEESVVNADTSTESSNVIEDSLEEKSEAPSEPEAENLTPASDGNQILNSEEICPVQEFVTPEADQNKTEVLSSELEKSSTSEFVQNTCSEDNQQPINEGNKFIEVHELVVEADNSVSENTEVAAPAATDLSKKEVSSQQLDNQTEMSSDEKDSSGDTLLPHEEAVNLSPVTTKSIDKGIVASKSDEEKGRSLEKTIKKMKEKIVESEKAKKEQDIVKPSEGSTPQEFIENKESTQVDESQTLKDRNENQKKSEKAASKEEVKEKSSSRHRKRHSRSPSKSRTLENKQDQSIDKEKSSRKENRRSSRSSSKSRSVDKDKHHKHSDGESDRKRRSKSKSVDEKDKKNQEELNGHRSSRSRSSSKSKIVEGKTKSSSEKSSSKHKPSDSKDKQGVHEEGKDHHKKRRSKSPPKSNEVKLKHSQKSESDKAKGRDKSEALKSKPALSKADSKSKSKTEEKALSQSSKDKINSSDVEKQKESADSKSKIRTEEKLPSQSSKDKSTPTDVIEKQKETVDSKNKIRTEEKAPSQSSKDKSTPTDVVEKHKETVDSKSKIKTEEKAPSQGSKDKLTPTDVVEKQKETVDCKNKIRTEEKAPSQGSKDKLTPTDVVEKQKEPVGSKSNSKTEEKSPSQSSKDKLSPTDVAEKQKETADSKSKIKTEEKAPSQSSKDKLTPTDIVEKQIESVDSKSKSKTEEKVLSQSSKDKLATSDVEGKQKEIDEKVSKINNNKSHKSKPKHQRKSEDSSSMKTVDNSIKSDEKSSDNKHHKSKPKESSKDQETPLKSVRDKHTNEIQKSDDHHGKRTRKSNRSHSREKNKTESGPRTEKRERSTKDKAKESDKKITRIAEEPKGNGASVVKNKSKEKADHKGHRDNSIIPENKNFHEKVDTSLVTLNLVSEEQLLPNKHTLKNLKGDIPKKRKYELVEKSSPKSEELESAEPKIPKLQPEIVVQPKEDANLKTSELPTEDTVINDAKNNFSKEDAGLKASESPTEDTATKMNFPKEAASLLQSSKSPTDVAVKETVAITDVSPVLDVSNNDLAEDLRYETFASGIKESLVSEKPALDLGKDVVVSDKAEVNEVAQNLEKDAVVTENEVQNLDILVSPLAPPLPLENSNLHEMQLRNENVPGISALEQVYVGNPFSNALTAIGMQVLTTTTASTVKNFTVPLPLIPAVASESINPAVVVTESLSRKQVSLSCTTSTTVQNTPSCSTAGLFTFNEEPETDNQENLNATDLFDASLGLGSTSIAVAEISNSMTLVQSLGPSTINFISEVSDNTEISDKPNSFNSNYPRRTRVTEIRCFVEKESTADHNYTLGGDPLLGGNNEDKNLLTTGLSLSDSPEDFHLNESNLEELSFNENNFIGENGTLDDLGLLLPCKKEKPDFDNINDDDTPKPEDVQTSIKHLNMLVGIPQSGQLKTISVDNSIDHSSNTDCSVSLGIDYAVNKLLNLGSGEASSQTNFFSTMSDIANMNIMESNVSSLHPAKEGLEEPIPVKSKEAIASICNIMEPAVEDSMIAKGKPETSYSYASSMTHSDSNKHSSHKVVVEQVEQCPITSVDQLKKGYISEPCERVEMKKTKLKAPVVSKPITFATFVQSLKKDKSENAKKKNDIDESFPVRKNNRTPVFPPKRKTTIQQAKSLPEKASPGDSTVPNNNKLPNAPESSHECRIRVKTDLVKSSTNSDFSQLHYISEHDQNIAGEVVLPFNKTSPAKPPDPKPTKHARFDKSGNDYIMENIINAHTDSKAQKSQAPDDSVDKKRKSTFVDSDTSDGEKHAKRKQRKSDDESDKSSKTHAKKESSHGIKPSTDEIFDQLLRQGTVNKCFVQKSNEQKTETGAELKNRGFTTMPDPHSKKDRIGQPAVSQHRDSIRQSLIDADSRRKPAHHNYDRKHAEKRPFPDASPKRFARNPSQSYSSKSDPSFSRDYPYKQRDRRSSTEHVNHLVSNSSKSERGSSQGGADYSWIAKVNDSGLFDTPPDLFMPPETKREDASSRK